MSNFDLKSLFAEARKEVEQAHEHYGSRSAAHKAALEIMKFERDMHYGEISSSSYKVKLKKIIEEHVKEITNETAKNKN